MTRTSLVLVAFGLAGFLAPASAVAATPPDVRLNLAAPVARWDEAIPLGNGHLGGLLWGEGSTLRLSLDRGDLWDERRARGYDEKRLNLATVLKLKTEAEAAEAAGDRAGAKRKFDEINRLLDAPYADATPTKLPGGRVEFDLAPGTRLTGFSLDLAGATAHALAADGEVATAFVHAERPVILVRTRGAADVRLMTTADVAKANAGAKESSSAGGVAKLGYPPAEKGADAQARWYVQPGADGFRYCVYIRSVPTAAGRLHAIVMTSTADGNDPLAVAKSRADEALAEGYDAASAKHRAWWADFWSRSSVKVPDPAILLQYELTNYYLGAASRRGHAPMPLQGVWTADNGQLPPWKGDYHNDLNTQMTYLSYRDAGRFEAGLAYLDFLWDLRPRFRRFAREYFGTDGGNPPGVMTLAGNPLGGWGQYSFSPTMGAWSAQLFYAHWLHTGDARFLAERAYPWCSDVGICLRELLRPDKDGRLVLPVSSSPEIFDNSPRAWLKPNSNYDLMSMRMLFLALREMATALGKTGEAESWGALAARLGDYHVAPDGRLLIAEGVSLPGSHRHLSNLIGVYPFNLVTIEGTEEDRRRIRASLAEWDRLGTHGWVGYSFSWMAALRARVGDAEGALRHLKIFTEAFVSRNGFHLNGDQLKKGYSGFGYRPFTLEGNFIAAQAVHEMLLQSWSPTPGIPGGSVIRVFPAVPESWREAEFDSLVAEGGHRVSARREGGRTVALRIVAAHDGTLRVRDNFGGRLTGWSLPATKRGADYEIPVAAGQVVEARFAE